ncbi:MAG: hypothetical protein IJT54_04535 [Candidatus Methanomethylophilaceae archaeon]|nr:hypothetical protein [Candidatus Methanomethylophilaceae archaeon]
MTEDLPITILKGLRGVVDAFYLDDAILEKVRKEEATVMAIGSIDVINEGFNEALKRDKVACIVKDPRFRLPPEPTVLLKAEDGTLMGMEVFPETAEPYKDKDNILWLSDGFIIFTDVMPNPGQSQAFIMPPIPFPELNESNGCYDVISCSPAPTCDKMIREWHGMDDNKRLASVLVAFNVKK